LIGFVLATASALLAVSAVAYGFVVHFPCYDPLFLKFIDGKFCFRLVESCLASARFGDQVNTFARFLSLGWECWHFGS
jgi:hypothetical protein